MNYSSFYSMILLSVSFSFIYFGVKAKIYRVSHLVFVFYGMVFSLAFAFDQLNYFTQGYMLFYGFHALLLIGSLGLMLHRLIKEFKKYRYVVAVLMLSIAFMVYSFFNFYDYFLEIHFFTIISNLFFVSYFVFQHKYKCGIKRIKHVRKI